MSYKVPGDTQFWKEMPHWYGFCSLAFHGWVLLGGIFLLQGADGARATFLAWAGAEQLLFAGSIISVLGGLLCLGLRTDAAELVVINGIYSLVAAFSTMGEYRFMEDGARAGYLLAPAFGVLPLLLLANGVYCVYRWVRWRWDNEPVEAD